MILHDSAVNNAYNVGLDPVRCFAKELILQATAVEPSRIRAAWHGRVAGCMPDAWTRPWGGRIGLSLAGYTELQVDEVVDRTVAVARTI